MASASCSEAPSDIRRLRAARLNFEAASFSLGIDTEAFRSIPSFDESSKHSSGCVEERNSLTSSPPDDGFLENCSGGGEEDNKNCKSVEELIVNDSEEDCEDFQLFSSRQQRRFLENCSGGGEEDNKNCKSVEELIVNDSEEDCEDFQLFSSRQQRRFKRLKRGPSSSGNEPLKGTPDLSRRTDIPARRLSTDPSEVSAQVHNGKSDLSRESETSTHRKSRYFSTFNTQPDKDPLPYGNDFKNQVPDGLKFAGIDVCNSREEYAQTCIGGHVLSSTDHRSGQKRSEPESSLCSGEVAQCSRDFWSREDSKFGFQRESDRTEGGLIFNTESRSTSQIDRVNPFVNTQPSSREDVNLDEDDIEEFSDDELFGSGSRTQRARRRSLRPQMSGPTPILLSSSPETSAKPVLHTPRADFPPKAPLRWSQHTEPSTSEMPNSEEDRSLIDDFASGSGWRRTKPIPPQHLNNSTCESQRTNSVPNFFTTSKGDLFGDTNLNSFYTETPARRDVVGPSQALRDAEGTRTEEDRIQAFLRQRFPHFKPVDALLVDGGLDNDPIFIDYRRQFSEGRGSTQLQSGNASMGGGTRWSPVRSINGAFSASPPSIPAQRRNLGKKQVNPRIQPKISNPRKAPSSGRFSRPGKLAGGSGEGNWRTVNGSRVYIVGNRKLSGQHAYSTYKKHSGKFSKKKSKRRQSTKPK